MTQSLRLWRNSALVAIFEEWLELAHRADYFQSS